MELRGQDVLVDKKVNDKSDQASSGYTSVANPTEGLSKDLVSREGSDSPMTEFIKSVQFVELPGASRQVIGQKITTSLASHPVFVPPPTENLREIKETPKKGAVDPSGSLNPGSDLPALESIWESPTSGAYSEEALFILASQMIETVESTKIGRN